MQADSLRMVASKYLTVWMNQNVAKRLTSDKFFMVGIRRVSHCTLSRGFISTDSKSMGNLRVFHSVRGSSGSSVSHQLAAIEGSQIIAMQ